MIISITNSCTIYFVLIFKTWGHLKLSINQPRSYHTHSITHTHICFLKFVIAHAVLVWHNTEINYVVGWKFISIEKKKKRAFCCVFFFSSVQVPKRREEKKNSRFIHFQSTRINSPNEKSTEFNCDDENIEAHQFNEIKFTLCLWLVVYLISINLLLSSAYAPAMTMTVTMSSTIATFYPVALCVLRNE